MKTLVWGGSIVSIEKKLGITCDALKERGADFLTARVQVSPAQEQALKQFAVAEGRAGWSSSFFVLEIVQLASGRDISKLSLAYANARIEVMTDEIDVILMSMKLRAELKNPSATGQVQDGQDHAVSILKWLAPDSEEEAVATPAKELLEAAERGTDVRWASMKALAIFFGAFSGLGNPAEFIGQGQFEARRSPDVTALRFEARLIEGLDEFKHALPSDFLPRLKCSNAGIIRVRPRGDNRYTGVALGVEIPSMSTMYAVWKAQVDC